MTVGDRIKDETEKIKLNFSISKHSDINNRIVIDIDNTGLDIDNKEHLDFVVNKIRVLASQMYAKTNGIPMKNIKYNDSRR